MSNYNLYEIDQMDGHSFEYFCADILKRNGFSNVTVTKGSGDYGIDILAERNGQSFAIQCKRYNGRIGNKAVQEALSGCVYYGYDIPVVLTNSYFTEQAKETARKTNVELWDRETLLSFISTAYPSSDNTTSTFDVQTEQSTIPPVENAAFKYSYRQASKSNPKTSSSNSGCGTTLLGLLAIVIIIGVFSGLLKSCIGDKRTDNSDNTTSTLDVQTEQPTIPPVETETILNETPGYIEQEDENSIGNNQPENADSEQQNEVLQDSWVYPELEDFDYEYKDGGIVLLEYSGTATSIIIPSSYEVENTVLPVLSLRQTFKNNTSIVNLIISDGIEYANSDLFGNFSSIDTLEHLYIPASLQGSDLFLERLTDGEILFYGGDEDQWQDFCYFISRSELSFKRVVLNSSQDECMENINTIIEDNNTPTIDTRYSPLSDFEYDTYNGEISLGHYLGKNTYVNIAPEYYVDGQMCPVTSLDNSFAVGEAEIVIIPEGVRTVTKATFNTSRVDYIFLPSSLVDVPEAFWGYIFDVDTIYYGGTENDFHNICSIDRWDIDAKHVVYEASPNDVPIE